MDRVVETSNMSLISPQRIEISREKRLFHKAVAFDKQRLLIHFCRQSGPLRFLELQLNRIPDFRMRLLKSLAHQSRVGFASEGYECRIIDRHFVRAPGLNC